MQSVTSPTLTGSPAAPPAVAGKPLARDSARALRALAGAGGLAAIALYAVIAVARLRYPFPLEILESNSLIEVHRLLAGQALYAPPSAAYVPDGYPPLYFAVSAATASVLGQGYAALRLVSLLSSLACFAVLARLVRRETGSTGAGLGAAGLLAATYFATGTWFDVARVDSLFLALSVAGLAAALRTRRARDAIGTGLLLGAAFLTKQSGLAEGIAVLAALAALAFPDAMSGTGRARWAPDAGRLRLAGITAAVYAAVLGASTAALGLASHGWYLYYVFGEMSQHALSGTSAAAFWTGGLLPALGLAVVAAALAARRVPRVLLAGCAALAVEGFAARAQTGSNLNDLLPAFLAVTILAGLALRPDSGKRWIPVAAAGLVIVQFAALAAGFRPARAVPPAADTAIGLRLQAAARATGGPVAIPADPGTALLAGLPATEDQVAAADILRAADPGPKTLFTASVARAVRARRYAAIFTQLGQDLRGYPAGLARYYRRCPGTLTAGLPPAPFRPRTAEWTLAVWLPAGRGSCAAVTRLLSGGAR